MSEAKPTPGVWKAKGRDVFIGKLRVVHAANAASQTPMNMRDEVEQAQENARFIADAGNTYNTTGLTPSQLVERVKELEEALSKLAKSYERVMQLGAPPPDALKAARAALSKARPSTAEGEAHADSVREDAALLSLLEELSDHDSYDTEYDGRMISLCPECGSQDGEHSKNCAFRRAKEYLAARKQAAAKEPSP